MGVQPGHRSRARAPAAALPRLDKARTCGIQGIYGVTRFTHCSTAQGLFVIKPVKAAALGACVVGARRCSAPWPPPAAALTSLVSPSWPQQQQQQQVPAPLRTAASAAAWAAAAAGSSAVGGGDVTGSSAAAGAPAPGPGAATLQQLLPSRVMVVDDIQVNLKARWPLPSQPRACPGPRLL